MTRTAPPTPPAAPARRSGWRAQRPVWFEGGPRRVVPSASWWLAYPYVLVVLDAVAMALASEAAILSRFGDDSVQARPYSLLTALVPPVWVAMMGLGRAYERRFLGVGSDEFRRVFDSAVRLAALVGVLAYGFKLDVSRGFVGVALPLATVLTLLFRLAARKRLHRGRTGDGRWAHRVLAVGSEASVAAVVKQTLGVQWAGLDVTGVLLVGPGADAPTEVAGVPVVGDLGDLVSCLETAEYDTVAVTDASAVGPQALRRLGWALEGRNVDLVVAPSLTDVAGPRIHVRPVAGLTLLHVEEPQLSGARQLVKTALDVLLSLLGLLVIGPVLLLLAVAIKLDSPGTVFFRQTRVGRDGSEFQVMKLRSMHTDAEARLAALRAQNESDGLLFKMKVDPRVTRVGRVLRRYSLDELPQVFNVLRGDMSLIGPRPPLPSEVRAYDGDVRRRLLVKPGMTGLWQTSGRSDLAWEESVRLDLFYVENWSIALDLQILWKTVFAVVSGRGAY